MKTINIVSNNVVRKDIFLEGVPVDVLDFGTLTKAKIVSKDKNLSKMEFNRREPSDHVLVKYNLNYMEYDTICNTLQDELKSYIF